MATTPDSKEEDKKTSTADAMTAAFKSILDSASTSSVLQAKKVVPTGTPTTTIGVRG